MTGQRLSRGSRGKASLLTHFAGRFNCRMDGDSAPADPGRKSSVMKLRVYRQGRRSDVLTVREQRRAVRHSIRGHRGAMGHSSLIRTDFHPLPKARSLQAFRSYRNQQVTGAGHSGKKRRVRVNRTRHRHPSGAFHDRSRFRPQSELSASSRDGGVNVVGERLNGFQSVAHAQAGTRAVFLQGIKPGANAGRH